MLFDRMEVEMSHPAEPERHEPRAGTANPQQSLWLVDYPYLGPPEEGQPRVDQWPGVKAPAEKEEKR